jgi:circadian clock protein KaiC
MTAQDARLSTGIDGLDEVLQGGLIPNRNYLVRGGPGSGKTMVALRYLVEGIESGQAGLFVNLEETTDDVSANAVSVGLDVEGVEFQDLSPSSEFFTADRSYDLFETSEVEQSPLFEEIVQRVSAIDPDRIVLDPITQLRYHCPDEFQFRKVALSLGRFLADQDATAVFTSQALEHGDDGGDEALQFVTDGTIELGRERGVRTLGVPKFRGSDTQSGDHTLRIRDDGLVVYPELRPGQHHKEFASEPISSGIPEVDAMMRGGLRRGTVSVLSGPSGAGKTTMGTQFMKEAAGRGERSVIYLFEESTQTFMDRNKSINVPVREMLDRGTLAIEEMEPLDTSPQEFAHRVRREVEDRDAQIVMIDGIDGYTVALQGQEDQLVRKLHALSRYLTNMGVSVILVDEVSTVTGEFQPTDTGISYLADNIVFLRHLELRGELRKAMGVLKMRTSDFERTLREFKITKHGITVGEPLEGLRGILTGTPTVENVPDASTE